jgi:hypothetical protein
MLTNVICFAQAQLEVFNLMKSDTMPKFVNAAEVRHCIWC